MSRILSKLPPLPTKDSVDAAAKQLRLQHYHIRDDLGVDVDGNVDLARQGLSQFPFKFHIVSGDFEVIENKLSSFNRFPSWVGGDINLRHNHFQSLETYHTENKGSLNVSFNRLKSLKGVPETIHGDFDCSHNLLENLNFLPQTIEGFLDCSHNRLQSLQGAELTVFQNFMSVQSNKTLRSLEGLPTQIDKYQNQILFFYDQNNIVELKGLSEQADKHKNSLLSGIGIMNSNVLLYMMHGGKYAMPFNKVSELQKIFAEQKKLKSLVVSNIDAVPRAKHKI